MCDFRKSIQAILKASSRDIVEKEMNEIWNEIGPGLSAFCKKHSRDPHMAEEALQNTLIAIFRKLEVASDFGSGRFRAWCFGIARNKLSDEITKRIGIDERFLQTDEIAELAGKDDPNLSASVRLDLEYALGLLDVLKPDCRALLEERYIFGTAFAEMAELWSVTVGAITNRVLRCLETAQLLMAKHS